MKALKVENLTKIYKNRLPALKGISFEVQQGDFFALLGPNGAGKTTLIGIISSLVKKTGGKVFIHNVDIDQDFEKAKSYLGVVPQEFNFSIFERVQDILVDQAGYYGIPPKLALQRAEKYLKKLDLWHKRREQPRWLSGGMKRRLLIARALIHEPKLLILDEPSAGVDVEIRRSMWDFLKEINQQGTTIILTTHYLEEAENLCKQVAIIDHGEIIENTSMSKLLYQLDTETFVLYLKNPVTEPPSLNGFNSNLIDPRTLEVDVSNMQNINMLFELLSAQKIEIASMRNKVNRLEKLFMTLTTESTKHDDL